MFRNPTQAAESTFSQITAIRKSIAAAVSAEETGLLEWGGVATLANSLAERQGYYTVVGTAARVLGRPDIAELPAAERMEEVREYATDILTAGADDRWSGRENDARRAYHDGRVEAAKDLIRWSKTKAANEG